MIDHFYPVDEAIFYFTSRIDGETNSAYCERLCLKRPELRAQIEDILAPSISLEKLLDAAITELDSECEFLFRLDMDTDGEKQPLWNAAMLISGYHAGLSQTIADPDELLEKRLSLCAEDKDRLFLSYLFDLGVANAKELFADAGTAGCVEEAISSSGINSLTRIKLLELYMNFEAHVKKLAAILRPAVKIINKNASLYKKQVKEQLARIEAAGDIKTYVLQNHNFALNDIGAHALHISVLAPHTVNIRDGLFNSFDVYIGTGVTALAALLYSGKMSYRLAVMFKLLSDETRLEMLKAISIRPMYGQELAEMFSVTAPTVSYHMTKLVMSGFAESYFEGGKSYFKANEQSVAALERGLAEYLPPKSKNKR